MERLRICVVSGVCSGSGETSRLKLIFQIMDMCVLTAQIAERVEVHIRCSGVGIIRCVGGFGFVFPLYSFQLVRQKQGSQALSTSRLRELVIIKKSESRSARVKTNGNRLAR